MRFKTIKYMEWAKTRTRAAIDLCSSGVDQLGRKDLNLSWEEFDLAGDNFYGYPPLLTAVAERYGVHEDNVVSTIGTSHALFLTCAALIEPGDKVLIESPVYEPLLAVPEAFDAQVKRWKRDYADGYQFSLEAFESSLELGTKFILLTNLHNPSGALLSRSFLSRLVRAAEERNAFVVIDEIYLEFTEDEPTAFHLADNVIVISSLTKVFGLGDLRCGWVLARRELAKKMRRIIDYINVEGTFIGEAVAHRMFDRLDTIKKNNRERIVKNKTLVKGMIDQEEGLSWVEPADGVVCFPKVESGLTGDDLAGHLRKSYGTAVVPGSFFEQPRHFRLGFGGDTQVLEAGLGNIRKALRDSSRD